MAEQQSGQSPPDASLPQSAGQPSKRFLILDCMRGFLVFDMIAYHAVWNLVYLFGMNWAWFRGPATYYVWQQLGCSLFIALSGFCWPLGKKPLRRGATVFVTGALVTLVTGIAMPGQQVWFGILTLLGSCMLLLAPLSRLFRRIPPQLGLGVSLALFLLFRPIGRGGLGLGSWVAIPLPAQLYQGPLAAFLGLTPTSFHSADYFPLFPWLFMFIAGYFLYPMAARLLSPAHSPGAWSRPFAFLGRHSLVVYLFHQPLLYLVMTLLLSS